MKNLKFHFKTSYHILVLVMMSVALSNCLPPKGIDNSSSGPDRRKQQSGGNQTAGGLGIVQMQFPDLSKLQPTGSSATSTNKLADTITAILVSVSPVDKSCKDASKFAETVNYTTTSITKKLNPGCDYHIKLALSGAAANGSDVVFYAAREAVLVKKSDIAEGRIDISMSLEASGLAKSMGFPGKISTVEPKKDSGDDDSLGGGDQNDPNRPIATPTATPTPTAPTPTPTQQVDPNPYRPTPTPTVPPSNGLPALPDSIGSMRIKGSSGEVNLASYWTTKYLYVEFSRPGCGPCVTQAQHLSQQSSRFSGGGNCKALIVIPSQQLNSWMSAIGGSSTFGGRSSYEYSGSHNGFARNFNGLDNIGSTPTMALIDRTGRVLDQRIGAEPGQAASLCR